MPDDTQLSQEDELLFRQIHPTCIAPKTGEPSSQAFCPSKKDNYKLSVDRSSLTTAEESYSLYTENWESVAVYGLTVGEFKGKKIPCVGNPLSENPAHALADYNRHHKSKHRQIAKRLKELALKRGELYSPPPSPSDTT